MRKTILDEIKKLAKAGNGQPPGVRRFENETGIRETAWRGVYWARWGDALIEAGFLPNSWQSKHEQELVFEKFIEACRHFSRVPTIDELKIYSRTQKDFPTPKSFYTHFGSKNALVDNLRNWVKGREEYKDIFMMIGIEVEQKTTSARSNEGIVYLIKSGSHFKIGRSDELERRVKEIRVSLPEAASLEHSIRTDDPAGIEAYWHRRFAERRANGEWFKLTASDVAAFKRRKYQ